MIVPNISKMIAEAMKAHDEIRLSTLRLLLSAFNYEFIAKQHVLNEEEEINVVKHEAKKRKEAIEAYTKAKALDRADKEQKELVILQEFLPAEMPDSEIEKIVNDTLKEMNITSMSEMGKAMGAVMGKLKGKADGNKVKEFVQKALS
jgi:uncharacterized protein YqeY